ncbi:MAG: ribose-phosphate diphosphokinase [Thermodesulfovibrionia bacterium]
MIFLTSSARHLKLKGRKRNYSLDKYPSGEIKINVIADVNSGCVFIIGSVLPDANSLLEIMIFGDVLKERGLKVNIVIPYLAYARQDKQEGGEPFAARVVCNILRTVGFGKAYVIDAHNIKLNRFFRFINVIPVNIFSKEFSRINDPIVIAPDKGGVKRAKGMADFLSCEMACIEKARLGPGRAISLALKGNVRNRNALIIDDMIDTGGTIINAADLLKKNGAKDVYVAATHGLFSGNAIKKLEKSQIKKIVITNTLPLNVSSNKIKVVKIEPLIEKIIYS